MWVDIEERQGPPDRVFVKAKRPATAIRRALEANDGPGLATIQGHPNLSGRRYADGSISITTRIPKG